MWPAVYRQGAEGQCRLLHSVILAPECMVDFKLLSGLYFISFALCFLFFFFSLEVSFLHTFKIQILLSFMTIGHGLVSMHHVTHCWLRCLGVSLPFLDEHIFMHFRISFIGVEIAGQLCCNICCQAASPRCSTDCLFNISSILSELSSGKIKALLPFIF